MANRRLFQFLYSRQPKLTMVQGQMTFAAGGRVVGSATGQGVYQIYRNGTGNYFVQLTDNYYDLIGADFTPISGVDPVSTNVASLVGSSMYQVSVVGNSTWSTVGLDTTQYGTATVGQPFVATAVAGSGTGTAKLIIPSNVSTVEIVPNVDGLLTNVGPNYGSNTGALGKGSGVWFRTLAPTTSMVSSAAVTTMAAVAPVGSSGMMFKLWFRDSSATP
jgi:hypothetical protein